MHRGGCGCPGTSGHASPNATVGLDALEEGFFASLDGQACAGTESLPTAQLGHGTVTTWLLRLPALRRAALSFACR